MDYSQILTPLTAQAQDFPTTKVVILSIVGLIFLSIFYIFIHFFRLWIQCKLTNAKISLMDLLYMTFKKAPPKMIVMSKIMAVKAGFPNNEETGITADMLVAHHLSGGNVPTVIRAMIAAQKAKIIELTFREAMAIDRAGRDVLEAVQTSVYPKVINCPASGTAKDTLDAVAKDGIQLRVRARVTVRANIKQLIGGATEETIIARVGEGIVSAIGSAETHKDVLRSPDLISQAVLAKRLDSQTAFEIVSIDIADIDVGDNIGARLQADQAEADTRVARAKAEGRRAMAVAHEQEKQAAIEESRAQLVLAEADVPVAISDAFQSGKLTISEYYKLRNIQSDTDMRVALAGGTNKTNQSVIESD